MLLFVYEYTSISYYSIIKSLFAFFENVLQKTCHPKKFFLFIYTNFFSLQNTNDTNAHLSSLISLSQQTALKEMSRVKIVKEAGAKPTDFENTVAKVRRSILTRSENRRGRGRVKG